MKSILQTLKTNKTLAIAGILVMLFIIFAATAMPYSASTSVSASVKSGLHSFSLIAGSLASADGDGGDGDDGDGDGDDDDGGDGDDGDGDGGPGDDDGDDGGGDDGGDDTPRTPTCSLSTGPSPISRGDVGTLFWTTTDATSGFIDHGVSSMMPIASGSRSVFPTTSTTYTATVTGLGGTANCSIGLDVTPSAPEPVTCTISASPFTITAGQSSTLSWSSTNAVSMAISTIGSVQRNGSQNVFPTTSTTYVATVTAPNHQTATCQATVNVNVPPPIQAPTCTISANPSSINPGGSSTLTWTTQNATSGSIDNGVGAMTPIASGARGVAPAASTTYTATVINTAGVSATCVTTVTVLPRLPDAPTCTLTANLSTINPGGSSTLTWTTQNATSGSIDNGVGAMVPIAGGARGVAPAASTTYTATVTNVAGLTATCSALVTVTPIITPPPTCTLTANPSVITAGSSTTLTWTTLNAVSGSIDNGVGAMTPIATGARGVSPTTNTLYTATVTNSAGVTATCSAPVTVQPIVIGDPFCTLTANPNTINPGGSSTLTWATTNAISGTIDNTVGAMTPIASGNRTVSPSSSTTYTATVIGSDGRTATCSAPVTVQPIVGALRCDSFTASPNSLGRGGGTSTLRWETTNATSVSIDNGVGSVPLDGNTNVQVGSDTTYTLTAIRGSETVTCATSVDVDEGGGGGGGGGSSPSPRCEFFRASDTKIKVGERVTLRWKTERGTELSIEDDRNNKIFKTKDDDDVDEGEVTVRPTRDTRYTLTVERGTRDDDCTVRVNVDDQEVSLILDRDQQPLTSISLTQVPYTGFDAGPLLTSVFYTLLALWAASVAYVLVIKKGAVFGFVLRGRGAYRRAQSVAIPHNEYRSNVQYPRLYAEEASATAVPGISARGHGAWGTAVVEEIEPEVEDADTYLKEHAHELNLILSNDAVRFVINRAGSKEAQLALLDEVGICAKAAYPREDGWIVINRERIEALVSCPAGVSPTAPTIASEMYREKVEGETVEELPETSSLAEAIASGHVTAAYAALGESPLFALADAASDLDALFRSRRGEEVAVSAALLEASVRIEDEQLEDAINALASAIDGIYHDEASAVKLAVMKAIKAVM